MSTLPHHLKNSSLLSECTVEQQGQIVKLSGDVEKKMRLVNLGFHTNSIVKVIQVRGKNMVVCVDGTRFAIDLELARNIEVEVLA